MIRKFLKPGEFHVTSKPVILETLVGSCVCICLYNIKNGWAAVIKTFEWDSDIGSKNIDVALRVLSEARISISKKEVSGNRGRRVIFNTENRTVTWRFAGDVGGRSRNE